MPLPGHGWSARCCCCERDNVVAAENLKIANERLLEAASDPLLQKLREQMQTHRQLKPRI